MSKKGTPTTMPKASALVKGTTRAIPSFGSMVGKTGGPTPTFESLNRNSMPPGISAAKATPQSGMAKAIAKGNGFKGPAAKPIKGANGIGKKGK